MPKVYTMD